MKKGKIAKVVATLGVALCLATSSIAPAYAAPREYECISVSVKTFNAGSLLSGIISKYFCKTFGHTYGKGTVVKAPTYTEEGTMKYVCILCGNVKNEAIDKLVCEDHDWVEVEFIDADETGDGFVKDECSICGETVTGTIHYYSYDDRVLVKEGSATEHDVYEYTCMNCGLKEEWDEHIYDEENKTLVKEETETECAEYLVQCKLCDDSYYFIDHAYEWQTVKATKESDGVSTCVCSHCNDNGYSYVLHNVDYDNPVEYVEATEGQDGYSVYKCTNCEHTDKYTEHLWDENKELIAPAADGKCNIYRTTCLNCGESYDDELHLYTTESTWAVEGQDGYYRSYCELCGNVFEERANHYYDWNNRNILKEADGEHGIEELTCLNCGEVVIEEFCDFDYDNAVRKDGSDSDGCGTYIAKCKYCNSTETYEKHDYVYNYVEETEEHDGVYEYGCRSCGENYKYEIKHYWDWTNTRIIEESTAEKHGLCEAKCLHCEATNTYEVCYFDYDNYELVEAANDEHCDIVRYTCTVCGDSFKADRHSYEDVREPATTADDHEYVIRKCSNCGEEDYRYPLHEYDYDNTTVLVEATETECATVLISCKHCDESYEQVDHFYVQQSEEKIEGSDKYLVYVECEHCHDSFTYEREE